MVAASGAKSPATNRLMMDRLMRKQARAMEWKVRELAAEETHALRSAVSADGRTDVQSMHP